MNLLKQVNERLYMKQKDLFEIIITNYEEDIKKIARAVRAIFYEVYPEVHETIWERQGLSGYGIGPKKMSQHFGWIMIAKNHVNMGFNYGTSLPDQTNLLEGTGKNMRHIKIKELSELNNPEIKILIESAISERKAFNT